MYFGISQFAFHIQYIGTGNAVIPGKITETKILPVKLGQLATGSRKRPGKILFYLLFADKINMVCLINSRGVLKILTDKNNLGFRVGKIDLFGKMNAGHISAVKLDIHQNDLIRTFLISDPGKKIIRGSININVVCRLKTGTGQVVDLFAVNRIVFAYGNF